MLLHVLRETNVSLLQTLNPETLLQKSYGRSPCIVLRMTREYKSSLHFSYRRNCEQSNWRVIKENILQSFSHLEFSFQTNHVGCSMREQAPNGVMPFLLDRLAFEFFKVDMGVLLQWSRKTWRHAFNKIYVNNVHISCPSWRKDQM